MRSNGGVSQGVMLAVAFVLALGAGCSTDEPGDQAQAGAGAGAATASPSMGGGVGGASIDSTAGASAVGATNPPGTGGSSGSGLAMGGSSGSSGSSGGAGDMTAAAPDAGASAPMSDVACTITPTLTMSPAISTVGIVEITTDLPGVDSGYIEFGLDADYGMQAPVDFSEPSYRTLLLGMKASHTYHYRVVMQAGDKRCTGTDATLETGPPPNQPRLFNLDIETPQPQKLNGGFTVTAFYATGTVFIIDADGDYVWWAQAGDQISRARMSYDGKYMWARNGNPQGGSPAVFRISMDGMQVESFGIDSEFGDSHHDLAVMPDETVLFIQHDAGSGCDKIMQRHPDGTVDEIINGNQAYASNNCWINSVHYFPDDDTITFSDRLQNCYVKMTRDGQVLWILGGAASTFTSGDALDWTVQHGHHVLAPDRMLMFENGAVGADSMAYEIVLDEAAHSANRVWQYDGHSSTPQLGDVQRLPNGNTLVTYSAAGTIHEVDPDEQLVQSMVWDLGGAVCYSQRRSSLYGPPPRL